MWICNLDIPTHWWEYIVCTICNAVMSPAQYMIDSQRSLKKKNIPLMVHTKEGAVVHRTTLILFHMKRFWDLITGEVFSLYSLLYLQIHCYKHYNLFLMLDIYNCCSLSMLYISRIPYIITTNILLNISLDFLGFIKYL